MGVCRRIALVESAGKVILFNLSQYTIINSKSRHLQFRLHCEYNHFYSSFCNLICYWNPIWNGISKHLLSHCCLHKFRFPIISWKSQTFLVKSVSSGMTSPVNIEHLFFCPRQIGQMQHFECLRPNAPAAPAEPGLTPVARNTCLISYSPRLQHLHVESNFCGKKKYGPKKIIHIFQSRNLWEPPTNHIAGDTQVRAIDWACNKTSRSRFVSS